MCRTWNDPHGNAPLSVEHSTINGIFLHTLYGPVHLTGGGAVLSPTGNVYILGSPVAPYLLGVPVRKTLIAMNHSAVNTLLPTELLYTCCVNL